MHGEILVKIRKIYVTKINGQNSNSQIPISFLPKMNSDVRDGTKLKICSFTQTNGMQILIIWEFLITVLEIQKTLIIRDV
jgi:hypothetical protein